jgi:hypothetical protein
VKREWKKRSDGGKDYNGQPETELMHEVHDFIKFRGKLREIPILRRQRRTLDALYTKIRCRVRYRFV